MAAPFNWKARVNAAVQASEDARPPDYGQPKLIASFRSPAAGIIRQAALVRGVSVAGFIRRATLSMAAEVLGIPYSEAIAADPTIHVPGGSAPAPDPTGKIGGPWEITGLK